MSAFVVGWSWSTTQLAAAAAGLGLLVLVFVTAVLVCCKYWRRTDTPRPTPPTEQSNRLLELGINVREN